MNRSFELTVMMYHYVRDRGDDADAGSGIPGMPVQVFEEQLGSLAGQYTFIAWRDLCLALLEEQTLPSSACLLTFDDGLRDHYINVFNILRARKLSGLFFILDRCEAQGLTLAHKIHFLLAKLGLVQFHEALWDKLSPAQREKFKRAERGHQRKYPPISTERRIDLLKAVLQRDLSEEVNPLLSELMEAHVGPEQEMANSYYLTPDQIREMRAGGMHFGGHSRSHPWLDWIDAESRRDEIKASAEWLRRFEPGPWAFAYPYGGLAEDSPHILWQHGFIAGFTTQTQFRHTDPFLIGRIDGEDVAQDEQGYA
jgi:peptidoglycan/xylan/chitin deacetylase (PgdA/CDA1 family)